MFSLPNDRNEPNEIILSTHLSEVRQAEITDHDVMNNWPAGWMDRHFGDKSRSFAPNLTCASYEKEAINNPRKDELAVLDGNTSYFSTRLITNSSSLVPLVNYSPNKRCFDTEDYTNNSWLISETAATILNLHPDLTAILETWKPSIELITDNEMPQSIAVTASQKLKNIVPVAFSFTPSLLQLNSLQKNIITADNKKQVAEKWYCVFCFNNARFAYEKCGITLYPELNGPWRTHLCKDSKGIVICPALAAHICRHCGATGKFAHTEKYCDSEKKRRYQRMKNFTRVE
ncbi:Uncharacterized protein ACO02O_10880 [Dirofilaria immitis]